MRKTIAAWLLAWMVVLAFGQGSAFAVTEAATKVDAKTQQARLAQLGTNPVDINHETNWDTDNIFVLVRQACGQLSFRDPKTKEIRWGYYCLPPGVALDVPRGSNFTLVKDELKRQEWLNVGVLDLPTGQATVTMCGNGFKPTERMVGKLDTGRQCPSCETKVVEKIVEKEVPVASMPVDQCPNMGGTQDRVPSGMYVDQNGDCQHNVVSRRRAWPWVVGVLGAGLLGYALSRGGDDDECDTCPGRIPKPAP